MSITVDEEEAVGCRRDPGGLGRVHDLQVSGLTALRVQNFQLIVDACIEMGL